MNPHSIQQSVDLIARCAAALARDAAELARIPPAAITEWSVANARARNLATGCVCMANRAAAAAEALHAQLDAQTIRDMARRGEIPRAIGDKP